MCAAHTGDTSSACGSRTRGGCTSGPHRCETIRHTVFGRPPYPGHHVDNWPKLMPVFLWKRPMVLVLEFQLMRHTSGLPHIDGLLSDLRECRLGDTIFTLPLDLATAPRKELTHLSQALTFSTVTKGTTPDQLVWWPELGLKLQFHRTVYICIS